MHYIIHKYQHRAWVLPLIFFSKEGRLSFRIEKCLKYFLVLSFELILKNWDILENDLMSELQYLIYYSQHNFLLNAFSILLSFPNYLAPIKMKMPISSSLFMLFTFQCPRKRFSPFVNEKCWVAHYIWETERCSGNEWWKISMTETICCTVFAVLE